MTNRYQSLQHAIRELRQAHEHIITVNNIEWYSLFKDEIRNSIAIEGVFANRNDLLNVLDKNKQADNQKTAAILGYFEAASFAYEYANNLYHTGEFAVRLSDLKQIHTLLLRYEKSVGSFTGKLGETRNIDVEVTESHFTPLQHLYLNDTLKLFVKWINKKLDEPDYDPVRLATLSHIIFETIHPFRDGNGRVGRIFLSFLLIGQGLINIAIKGITRSQRELYYHALEIADDEIENLLRKIESNGNISYQIFNQFAEQSDIKLLENLIYDRLTESVIRLKNKQPITYPKDASITLKDAAKLSNYSQDYLRNLINRGKLRARKQGKLWTVMVRDMENYLMHK